MTVTLPIRLRVGTEKKLNLKEVIPGVVYGPKQKPQSIAVERKAFEKVFKTAGESTVITLEGLEVAIDTLVKDVSFSPTKGGVVHVDFYAIEKGKEIVTHVPLHFIGEAPATKLGAVLNKVLHEVTVSCLAADLPAHIEVDLSLLEAVDSKIKVSQIKAPKKVTITTPADEIVVIAEVVKEEVVEAVPVAAADVPVVEKDKTTEEGA